MLDIFIGCIKAAWPVELALLIALIFSITFWTITFKGSK